VRDGGDDACCSVGGRGDDAASGGVLFIDGHGVDGDPVERGERIDGRFALAALAQALGETMRAAADVEAAGKNAFGRDAAALRSLA
jgi:hypothetical protein